MMGFHLEIALVGEAFDPDPGPELARLVRKVADRVEHDPVGSSGAVLDLNGNRVGSWWVKQRSEVDA